MYEDQARPQDVDVVLPDHIQKGIYATAPPSYEEIMGAQAQTSLQKSIEDLPPLAYIDIMPRRINEGNMKEEISPQYESFSTLMGSANMWLAQHPQYAVWKCESVERQVQPSGEIDLNRMCSHQSTYGFNVYVTGIRLWLMLQTKVQRPQQIGVVNFLPQNANVTKTIQLINNAFRTKPLPGLVINLDMCSTIVAGKANLEMTCRSESGSRAVRIHTHLFRVFFLMGPPALEEIGTEVFTPSLVAKPKQGNRARYQPFPEIVNNAASWLRNQPDKRAVSIISRPVHAEESSLLGSAVVRPDATDTVDATMGSGRTEVRAIRIFYVRTAVGRFPTIPNLTTKLFTPERLGGEKQFETMSQTMFRIEAWLRITGMQVLTVETVKYKLKAGSASGVDEITVSDVIRQHDSKDWVTALRLYFATGFHEPPKQLLPASPKKKSSACSIL